MLLAMRYIIFFIKILPIQIYNIFILTFSMKQTLGIAVVSNPTVSVTKHVSC